MTLPRAAFALTAATLAWAVADLLACPHNRALIAARWKERTWAPST